MTFSLAGDGAQDGAGRRLFSPYDNLTTETADTNDANEADADDANEAEMVDLGKKRLTRGTFV